MAEIFDSLPGWIRLRIAFVQYLIAFCCRLEVTIDVISGKFVGTVVLDNRVKFGYHRLNPS